MYLVIFGSLFFSVGQERGKADTPTEVIKWCQRVCWSPPQTSHPEHTGKVSVRKKVGQNCIYSYPLAFSGINQAYTLSDWLHTLSFIVPSRQAAAV